MTTTTPTAKRLGRPKVDIPQAQLEQLSAECGSLHELAQRLDVSRNTAERLLADANIKFQRKWNRRIAAYKQTKPLIIIAQLYSDWNTPDAELARRSHCTREFVGQVRTWMRTHGVLPKAAEAA